MDDVLMNGTSRRNPIRSMRQTSSVKREDGQPASRFTFEVTDARPIDSDLSYPARAVSARCLR